MSACSRCFGPGRHSDRRRRLRPRLDGQSSVSQGSRRGGRPNHLRADLMAGGAGDLPSPHRRLRCGLGRTAQRCGGHRSDRGRRPLITIPRAAVGDARLVPATIAAAVGLELGGGEAQRVAQALADRRLLLVLDTCEHVIAAIARVAEAMLGMSSAPHIIATSREALEQGANGSIQSNPSPCQRRMSRLSTISCSTGLFGCSSSG